MARPLAPTPIQQLPPIEYILAVVERFKLMKQLELARLGLEHAMAAEKIWRKDLKLIVDAQVDSKTAARPVLDVKQLASKVNEDSNTMARLLKRAGLANEVSTALKQHNGTLPIAAALRELASGCPNGAVRGLLSEFKQEVSELEAAQQREQHGGHPAFDLKTSKAARDCWVHVDVATDILAACLRILGITNDATYAARPTVKTVLRPSLEVSAAPAPRRGRRPGKKNVVSRGATAPNAAGTNGAAAATPGTT